MTLVDWHPEDLLDKHYAGTLSTSEQDALAQHTAACSACRFELLLEGDFEQELLRAPLRPLPQALSPKRIPAVLVLAAALVIAGSAAAIVRAESNLPRYVVVPKIAEAIALSQNAAPAAPSAEPLPAPEMPDAPAIAPDNTPPPASAAALLSASELFARGNAARRDGRRVEALALYRELQERYPASPEAKLSQATMGRMLLDDDPARALDQFDGYLDSNSPELAEEAMVGRALSLMRLGDRAAERRAWEALLLRHPKSIHAGRARTRLAELAAPE